ncbi:LlaJI family restriction endonuclease [Alkalihalobacterium sp. APHAB7]|uniref:LlaJI family restriction endonuclease n=1 Tax=Alkalihalobacterium sp. APHAB7 TaxID=3402081 RepID=UPI003AAA4AC5
MELKPVLNTFVEFKEYKNIFPSEFVNQMLNREICSLVGNKIKFKVTGLLIYNNTFIIIFPKSYKIPKAEKDLKENIQILLSVLIKYKNSAHLSLEEVNLLGGNNGGNTESIITAYSLINDYINNGLLMKEMRITSEKYNGNTNWSTTINKKNPLFTGKSVIYTETVSRKTVRDRQNLLIKLHEYCVYKSVEKYGWLLGIPLELAKIEMPCDIRYAVNFLQMELNSTFVERELIVIQLIKDFLSGIELINNEAKLEVLATPYFYLVWEAICSQIFKNQYKKLRQTIPRLKWEIESNAAVKPQRPDIMFLNKQKMYVLDAKYYNTDMNLPGWHDVVKQLFYASTIFNHIKSENFKPNDPIIKKQTKCIKKVENAFLFPTSDEVAIKYIGKVNIENNDEFDSIKAYKINTLLAMKCYIRKVEYNFVKTLIDDLDYREKNVTLS